MDPRVILVAAFAAGGAAVASMFLVNRMPASFVAAGAAAAAIHGGLALLARRPLRLLVLTAVPIAAVVVWVGAFLVPVSPESTVLEHFLVPHVPLFTPWVAGLSVVAFAPVVCRRFPRSREGHEAAKVAASAWLFGVVGVLLGADAAAVRLLDGFPGLGRGGITAIAQALALSLGAALAGAALQRRPPRGRRRAAAWAIAAASIAGAAALAGTVLAHLRPLTGIVAVVTSGGDDHSFNPITCALAREGDVLCWGNNLDGRLGDGTLRASDHPVAVVGVHDAVQIAVGDNLLCALRRSGEVVCWDHADVPRRPERARLPAPIPGLPPVRRLGEHGCGLTREDDVVCWTKERWWRAAHVEGAVDLVATDFGGCARTRDGFACWAAEGNTLPPCLPPATGEPPAVPGSLHGLCSLTTGGRVRCWQDRPASDGHCRRVWEKEGIEGARAMALGEAWCFIDGGGAARCRRDVGVTPETVIEERVVLEDVVSLATNGVSRFCAVRSDGTVWCWGRRNDWGELGDGTHRARSRPTLVRR